MVFIAEKRILWITRSVPTVLVTKGNERDSPAQITLHYLQADREDREQMKNINCATEFHFKLIHRSTGDKGR